MYDKRQKFIGNVLQLFLHDGKQKGSVIKNRPDYFFQSFIQVRELAAYQAKKVPVKRHQPSALNNLPFILFIVVAKHKKVFRDTRKVE